MTDAPQAVPTEPKPESSFSIVNVLSVVIVFGYIAWMPLWMFFPPTKLAPEILAILNQMMGSWGYAFAAVIGFHIGTNRTSKDKDATILAQAKAGIAPPSTDTTVTTTTPPTVTTTTAPADPHAPPAAP